MSDNAPLIVEFGPGATTCDGDMTGCAVCATGSVGLRYGKAVPRLDSGHPDMRTLGYRMGKRHRDLDSRVHHGESLSGSCTPPHSGTNWCAYCAFLQLKAWGLPAGYDDLSDAAIASHLKVGHSLIVPGLYSRIPIVARNSYSGSIPARGRSDTGFGGGHMVAAHEVTLDGAGRIVDVIVCDPDFGSASRPIVPPHSLWSWQTFLNFRHGLGWGIAYVQAKPLGSTVPPAPPAKQFTVTVRPASGDYWAYDVVKTAAHPDGTVRDRHVRQTTGFQANCSPAKTFLFAAEHAHVELVQITSGGYKGRFVGKKWSNEP